MRLNTRMLFLMTLVVGVLLHVSTFLHELSFDRFFRDIVSLYVGAMIVACMSALGAMKQRQVGAIAGTVVGMLVWGSLHRIIWLYEFDFTPFLGVQVLFLVLISATVNRMLFLDMSRDESEQREIDPADAQRLHSAKQELHGKLYPSQDRGFGPDIDSDIDPGA